MFEVFIVPVLLLHLIAWFVLVFVALSVGSVLCLRLSLLYPSDHKFMRAGVSYLVGVSALVFLVKTLSILFGSARYPTLFALFILFFVAIFKSPDFGKRVRFSINRNLILKALIVSLIIFSFCSINLFFWLPSLPDSSNPFDSIGSLHSVRYAWISNYILEVNVMPILAQNYAQSILAYTTGLLGGQSPYLYLWLWLNTSIVFLWLLVFGIYRQIGISFVYSLFGATIFMIGGTALSFTHVLVIDSGNPFAMNGYSDQIHGVLSIFALFLLFVRMDTLSNKNRISVAGLTFLLIVVLAGSFSYSPQNIPLLSVLFFVWLGLQMFSRTTIDRRVFYFFIAIIIASLISLPQGGMLTPKQFLTPLEYSGLMDPRGSGSFLAFSPGLPFHYGFSGSWTYGDVFMREAVEHRNRLGIASLPGLLWLAESIALNSIRIFFFPLTALLILRIEAMRCLIVNTFRVKVDYLNLTVNVGLILLFMGSLISGTFSLNGYKWELSRFLIPGTTIGMFCVSLLIIFLLIRQGMMLRFVGLLLSFLIICGPVLNASIWSSWNAYRVIRHDKYRSPVTTFLGSGPTLNADIPQIDK